MLIVFRENEMRIEYGIKSELGSLCRGHCPVQHVQVETKLHFHVSEAVVCLFFVCIVINFAKFCILKHNSNYDDRHLFFTSYAQSSIARCFAAMRSLVKTANKHPLLTQKSRRIEFAASLQCKTMQLGKNKKNIKKMPRKGPQHHRVAISMRSAKNSRESSKIICNIIFAKWC